MSRFAGGLLFTYMIAGAYDRGGADNAHLWGVFIVGFLASALIASKPKGGR